MTRVSHHESHDSTALSAIYRLFYRPKAELARCPEKQQSRKPRASKRNATFLDKRKGSMVGFISNLAPLLNYLRRRSPGPPFPPDHRQAGERGAKRNLEVADCASVPIHYERKKKKSECQRMQ